jgi:hypothetical protein
MSKQIVVNFFAGPGAGKSTLALLTTGYLKLAKISADYMPEVPKSLIWAGNTRDLGDQLYIDAMTYKNLRDWIGPSGPPVIVSDSPLCLHAVYAPDQQAQLILNLDWDMRANPDLVFLDYFVLRGNKGYTEVGRIHSHEEAKELDNLIFKLAYKQCDNLITITPWDTDPSQTVKGIVAKVRTLQEE